MREWAAGIVGGVLGALFTVAIWLTWPLPDPEIDWRKEFFELVAQGNCFAAMNELATASDAEPDAIAAFSRRQVGNIDCGSAEANALLPEFWGLLDRSIENGRQQEWVEPGPQVLAANFADWRQLATYRRRVGLTPYTFLTLHQSFRCNTLNISTRSTYWYGVRNANFTVLDRPDYLIPAWERRIEECTRVLSRMQREASLLQGAESDPQLSSLQDLLGGKANWLGRLTYGRDRRR